MFTHTCTNTVIHQHTHIPTHILTKIHKPTHTCVRVRTHSHTYGVRVWEGGKRAEKGNLCIQIEKDQAFKGPTKHVGKYLYMFIHTHTPTHTHSPTYLHAPTHTHTYMD